MKHALLAITTTVCIATVAAAAAAQAATTATARPETSRELTSGALAAEASPTRTTAAVPCAPTTSTIKGKQAIHYCGPATATIRIKGRTYRFKNGYCQSIHVSDITNDITLGTIVQGAAGNAGQPYFALDINKPTTASLLNPVYFGGKRITDGGLGPVSGALTSKGTFKIGAATGTWNCHGVFVKH